MLDLTKREEYFAKMLKKGGNYYNKSFEQVESGGKSFNIWAFLFGEYFYCYRKDWKFFGLLIGLNYAVFLLEAIFSHISVPVQDVVRNLGYIMSICLRFFLATRFNENYLKKLKASCEEIETLPPETINKYIKKDLDTRMLILFCFLYCI